MQFLAAAGVVDRVYIVNLEMNISAPLLNGQNSQVLMEDFQNMSLFLYTDSWLMYLAQESMPRI